MSEPTKKLVPTEPNDLMLDAGCHAIRASHDSESCHGIDYGDARDCYAAMLAAAPPPRPLDDPILQEVFSATIGGAIGLGGIPTQPPPPDGHWLTDFWQVGRSRIGAALPQWLPISGAPKDGTHVLLGSPPDGDEEGTSTVGWWQEAIEDGVDYKGGDAGFVDHNFNDYFPSRSFGAPHHQYGGRQPTHWMPIPQPPNSAVSEAKP